MTFSRAWLRSVFVVAAVFAAVLLFTQRSRVQDRIDDIRKPAVPSAVPYRSATPTPAVVPSKAPAAAKSPAVEKSATPMPTQGAAVNLDIPFVSQAPHMVWDTDHEDFCEEAATLMAASYINGDRTVTNIDVAEAALQDAKAWEMKVFGYFESTTAAQTARMLREHFGISAVTVVSNPSEADIKAWVAAGKAVVVPAAGRMLGNPNFTGLGPIYHMLVVKGYTAAGQFITNDPGTRKGADYLYAPSVLMNAIHDWNNGDVQNGARVVIVVG